MCIAEGSYFTEKVTLVSSRVYVVGKELSTVLILLQFTSHAVLCNNREDDRVGAFS